MNSRLCSTSPLVPPGARRITYLLIYNNISTGHITVHGTFGATRVKVSKTPINSRCARRALSFHSDPAKDYLLTYLLIITLAQDTWQCTGPLVRRAWKCRRPQWTAAVLDEPSHSARSPRRPRRRRPSRHAPSWVHAGARWPGTTGASRASPRWRCRHWRTDVGPRRARWKRTRGTGSSDGSAPPGKHRCADDVHVYRPAKTTHHRWNPPCGSGGVLV